nr:hypothetical protein B0A51_06005 [Rachicladosporium sp. CCFEE 5018]
MRSVTVLPFIAAIAVAVPYVPCGILGPDYPAPLGLSSDLVFKDVVQNISDALKNATVADDALLTTLKANQTSWSIGIFELDSTLLSVQHTADTATLAKGSVKAVTEDSIYRIGSLSKLITAYTYLVEVGHAYWDRPVTEFVPELAAAATNCSFAKDPLECTDWSSITLGALASHMAGIARGHTPAPPPTSVGGIPITSFGLPPKPPVALPQCSENPCLREDALNAFLQEPPTVLPFRTPAYSNGGYQILGYALENITGRSMEDLMHNDVFAKLNMGNSSYALKPNTTTGIIPGNVLSSYFAIPIGDAGAAGGVYSTQRDLEKFGQAILNSTQISAVDTRRWMKPLTHTSVWQQSVGIAWEIIRWQIEDRVVDVYTKQGDIGLYHSVIILIPDYNVGFTVLTAGTGGAPTQLALSGLIMETLLPGLEATARSQAQTNLAGTYKVPSLLGVTLNSSITLITEPGLPGLKVTSFTSNSTDVLNVGFPVIFNLPEAKTLEVRLYPTLIIKKLDDGCEIRKWHAVVTDPGVEYPSEQIRANNCVQWELLDLAVYGAPGADEFWIKTDAEGKGYSILGRVFGVEMLK